MAKTKIIKTSQNKTERKSTKLTSSVPTKPSLRGFALMSPERRKALGSIGGKTAHAKGTANKFTSRTASRAGRLPHVHGTAHQWTSDEAREAGLKGAVNYRRYQPTRVEFIEQSSLSDAFIDCVELA